ncbi:S8 family serine peptidase [Bryobacter aggregatus]|uniref:S8 family serine peptidase n=1 Tax=Bryobacter aggregatus TaxID=360054 RepID=UPI00068A450E|nr:S8 family serine peptidase [Bryobacter aggregatus]
MDRAAQAINANIAWSFGGSGKGIGVAIIDSGIHSRNAEVSTQIVYSENFLQPLTVNGVANPLRSVAPDDYGHGTHIAGAIAGSGVYSGPGKALRTIQGIAPQVSILNLKVLDGNGDGSDSAVIEAIDRAISLRDQYKIRILNLALGRNITDSFVRDPLCKAVERAWAAGLVVVVAAGNEGRLQTNSVAGYGTIQSPGNSPWVITVGAMRGSGTPYRDDDEIATYSSKGPTAIDHVAKPDLVAPGNLIDASLSSRSSLAKAYPQNLVDASTFSPGSSPNYITLSGTSMASAVTSGAIALLLQLEPNLTPDQVKARLMLTASKKFPRYGSFYQDYSLKVTKLQTALTHTLQTIPALQLTVDQTLLQLNGLVQQLAVAQTAANVANAAVTTAQNAVSAATNALAPLRSAAAVAQANATAARQKADAAYSNWQTAQDAANKASAAAASASSLLEKLRLATLATTAQLQADLLKTTYATLSLTAQTLQATLNTANGILQSALSVLSNAESTLVTKLQVKTLANETLNTLQTNVKTVTQTLEDAQAALADALQAVATLTNTLAQTRLLVSNSATNPSRHYDSQYDLFTIGAGYLDLGAAIQNRVIAPTGAAALSPVAYYNGASAKVQITANYGVLCGGSSGTVWGPVICASSQKYIGLWGANQAWSHTAVWGDSVLLEGSTLWGATAAWGTAQSPAFPLLWDSKSMFASSTVGGSSALWGSFASTRDTLSDGDIQ